VTAFRAAARSSRADAPVTARQAKAGPRARRTLAYNPGVPETSPFASRPAADRCPGVLRFTEAADGYLARVRLPGGFVTAGQLRALARLAGELGDGRIELTSRGNVQLRALAAEDAARLTDELAAAGLLPSLDHDRVRNVLASPLAGLDGGRGLAGVVGALDAGLCARPRLAGLSGRFLFAVDDGRGDVAGLGADVTAVVRADGALVNGLAVSGPAGDRHPAVGRPRDRGDQPDAIAAVMLAFAEAFLDERAALGSAAWRIAGLPGGPDRIRAVVAGRLGLAPAPGDSGQGLSHFPGPAARPVGVITCRAAGACGRDRPGQDQGSTDEGGSADEGGAAVALLAPLGRLTVAQVGWLAGRVSGPPARVTPWRGVVLPGQADPAAVLSQAAAHGFGTDERSPWLRVSACAGRPGCASALADVQADALGFSARWPGRTVHVSGCARHCGRPATTEIDVTATSEGYQVAGA
jgi:precorrin-3B synthase